MKWNQQRINEYVRVKKKTHEEKGKVEQISESCGSLSNFGITFDRSHAIECKMNKSN